MKTNDSFPSPPSPQKIKTGEKRNINIKHRRKKNKSLCYPFLKCFADLPTPFEGVRISSHKVFAVAGWQCWM
jgi:hypothetical protein